MIAAPEQKLEQGSTARVRHVLPRLHGRTPGANLGRTGRKFLARAFATSVAITCTTSPAMDSLKTDSWLQLEHQVFKECQGGRTVHMPHMSKSPRQRCSTATQLLLLILPWLCEAAHTHKTSARPGRALLVIDVQGCFLPGGALPVQLKSTDHLITQINTLRVAGQFDTVVLTQDYHPPNHVSFAAVHNKQPAETVQLQYTSDSLICGFEHLYPEVSAQCTRNNSSRDNAPQAGLKPAVVATHTVDQIMWPVHCVQNTQEAALHPGLLVHPDDILVRKGWQPHIDVYSAFVDSNEVQSTGLAKLLLTRGISSVTVVGVALEYCVLWTALDSVKLGFDTRVVLDATASVSAAGARNAEQRLQDAGVQLQHSIWDAVSEPFVAAS